MDKKELLNNKIIKENKIEKQKQSKEIYKNVNKLDNMINIISYKCIYKGCNKIPIFNFINESKGI